MILLEAVILAAYCAVVFRLLPFFPKTRSTHTNRER